MIKVDNIVIEANQFPDHTLLVKAPVLRGVGEFVQIAWNYESDAELFTLICLRKHYGQSNAILWMDYCPHARMDRVKESNDVFTLKYFADVINSLNFAEVRILDPHSNVCSALIDNVKVEYPQEMISKTISAISDKTNLVAFYPDEGAMKRGTDYVKGVYAFGIKKRDWETGKILGLELMNKDVVKDRDVLIIDDICSRGGTFYHSAKALHKAGAAEVNLYITHCEFTIHEGDLREKDLINQIYTTDSILRQTYWFDKINFLN